MRPTPRHWLASLIPFAIFFSSIATAMLLATSWSSRDRDLESRWFTALASGNPTLQAVFRTQGLIVEGSGTFHGSIQVGEVPVDFSQQVMLITESTIHTQGQLWIQEDDTGHTGNLGNNEAISIVMRNNTGFDSGSGSAAANASGVDIVVAATHTGSAGLTCTAVRANSACDAGASNYSFYSEHGTLRQFEEVSFGPGLVGLGNNVSNFEVPGSASTTARIGIGALPGGDGTNLQTKNTVAGSALSGVEVGLDTSLNAGIRGGYLILRGAGGGFGGNSAGTVVAGGAGFPFVGSVANELSLYSELNQPIVLGADSSGFTSWGRLTPKNHLALDTGSGTPTLDAGCTSGGSSAISGSDNAFKITTGVSSTACTITFKNTWTAVPICTIQPEGSPTLPTCTISATAITCATSVAATKYNFICIGAPGST